MPEEVLRGGRFVDVASCLYDVCRGPLPPSGLDEQALANYEEQQPDQCRATEAELVRIGPGDQRVLPANCKWVVQGRCKLVAGALAIRYVGEGKRPARTVETYTGRLTDSLPQAVFVTQQLQALEQGDARE